MERRRRSSRSADSAPVDLFDRDLEATVRKALHNLLPTMKPELSEVFYRAEILGQSRGAIAASLGIPTETVDLRLGAARAELRRLLESCARYHLNRPQCPDS